MLVLILLLIVGSIFAYLSQNNFVPVSVHLGPYFLSDIPLFYVILGSFVTGIVMAYLVYLIHSISTSWTLRGKNIQIKKNTDEVLELTKRVHQLELENEKLKHTPSIEPEDSNAL